jgi:uncharacterized protein (DUF2267 family)
MDEKIFYQRIAGRLRCDERRAEGLTLAVFQELRERITAKEAAHVAAQLPKGLRRLWDDNEHADRPVHRIHEPEFIGRVRMRTGLPDDDESRRAVRAVFGALQQLLGSPSGMEGEAWDVFSQLPKDMKKLWLGAGNNG